MKKYILFLSVLFILGCGKKILFNSQKDTYYDDIADITYLDGSFFTTNNDLSNNSGSQLNLIKFSYANDSLANLDDSYDLNMNGQGYLAITNNGTDLFLQSKMSHLLIKCSAIGEFAITSDDTLSSNWQPCGITFNNENDSIISLYRNLNSMNQYRARSTAQDLSFSTSDDIIFNMDFIDTTYIGVYAIDYNNSNYYMLGADTSHNDILIIANNEFHITAFDTITDSKVTGLCFKGIDLFLSYRDKRIEKWNTTP